MLVIKFQKRISFIRHINQFHSTYTARKDALHAFWIANCNLLVYINLKSVYILICCIIICGVHHVFERKLNWVRSSFTVVWLFGCHSGALNFAAQHWRQYYSCPISGSISSSPSSDEQTASRHWLLQVTMAVCWVWDAACRIFKYHGSYLYRRIIISTRRCCQFLFHLPMKFDFNCFSEILWGERRGTFAMRCNTTKIYDVKCYSAGVNIVFVCLIELVRRSSPKQQETAYRIICFL